MTEFTYGLTTVAMGCDPLAPLQLESSIAQQVGYDSGGAIYVYDRSQYAVREVTLEFSQVTAAVLAALKSFVTDTVSGARHLFTWTDHAAATHTVRYRGLTWQEYGPDRWRVTLSLEEIV